MIKKVEAWMDINNKVHPTKERAVKGSLRIFTGYPDIERLVKNRERVIEFLKELDNPE